MRRFLLVASAILLVASAALAADRSYRSKNHFSMRVPEGWSRIDDATLRKTARLTASALGTSAPSYEAAFEHEDADESFEYPYVLVQFVSGSTSGAYRDLENELMKAVRGAASVVVRRIVQNASFQARMMFSSMVEAMPGTAIGVST